MSKAIRLPSPTRIGEKVFIQTTGAAFTGVIVNVNRMEIVLASAAWIPDTGRYADAMKSGNFVEVEPYPADWTIGVQRALTVNVVSWKHSLPGKQK